MKYNFDEIVNRRGTYSMKWDGGELIKQFGLTERYDEDTIPLFTADMDLPVPQPLVEALHKTVDHRIYGYSVFPDEYFDAIQSWLQNRHGWKVEKEQIVYSPGTVHALNIAVKAFTNPEEGIIIQRPVYPPFTSVIEGNGRKVVNNALVIDGDGYYSIDFEDFEAKAKDDHTTMFILCHPHNPTGRVFNEEELKKMAAICHENNVLIVADEIHGDLLRRGKEFIPMAKIADHTDHLITCTAINKTFNVAGLHCTNVIISDEELRTKFATEMGMQLASPFAIAALIAVYNEGEDWLEQLTDYVDGTMAYIKEFLAENMPEVKVSIPEGTYIMWLDFSGYGISAKEIHDRIYNKANVLLEDGSMFGEEGEFYQRICTPSPRPLIREALERIASEFEDISHKNVMENAGNQ
ncbi:class I and II aminotransferase [Planococcus antarcticus DSM 14505]|uniref:cysteine-S-conjugate beta-lyase n=1 Tax=Planococcus antarcticus DSM 14505 TaxID=1185653 RepID=A0A1C7DEG3_9BACL|nr:MalY/PatB family protein [Planococcus antarcticus]ANU09817.1 aminotransferase [Planococcus antarcticus DSM 14505]EIM07582.1 class I and II aminotransferase [Planococcus antarcticus DSM 14505]